MKTAIALVVSTLYVSGAYAQSHTLVAATPPSRTQMTSASEVNAKIEMHVKDLHARLNITPAEEALWATVAQAMRESADDVEVAIKAREAGAQSATAIADLSAYGAIAQAHADGVKRMSTAFGPLYAAMSDDQKKIADDVFAQRDRHEKKSAAVAK
ncbi:MAG: Spy/CpxP family protein refolding chaperone [Burkholderiaceae bacterium]|jgi:hypothetical protein